MDLLKAQIERLQKQLSGLTATQKMLTASLVAIMLMTLFWWGRYGSEPEMEPVLDQSFSQEDVSRITAHLASRGIRYNVSADRILVPADRKFEVLAALSYEHLLPRNTATGFEEMVSKMNPLQADSTTDKMFNHGKEMMLAQIIQGFPNVAKADVMIDPTRERHVEGSVEPSATVDIQMQDGASAAQQLVDAAADVVQGAQSGLDRAHIKVVVGGVPRRVHNAEEGDLNSAGSDQLELAQKAELLKEERIRDYLGYIQGLKVFVTVKVNSKQVEEKRREFDGKKAVQKETESLSETTETNSPGAGSGEPGVASNAPLSVPTPAPVAAGASSTEEKNENKFENFVPETNTTTRTPAGDVSVVAATVRVPMAYFAAIYTKGDPNTKDPTSAQLQPLIASELPKIRNDVLKCTGLTSDSDVAVETYIDAAPVAAPAPQAASASVVNMLGGHGKELSLGALAVMSLFMVSMMVKKGTPAALVAPVAVSASGESSVLSSGEQLAGEAGLGSAMLDGMELDEDAVRNQQMLDQVSTMVKENPDAAALLVKRWLNRS